MAAVASNTMCIACGTNKCCRNKTKGRIRRGAVVVPCFVDLIAESGLIFNHLAPTWHYEFNVLDKSQLK